MPSLTIVLVHLLPLDDMKTKNQTERSGAVPAGTAAAAAAAAAPAVGGARGKAPPRPPRLECEQGRKWVVENQASEGGFCG